MYEKRILLTEGKKIVAEKLGKALSDAEYEVDLAVNGKTAIQLFNNRAYDLALIDYHLPDTNGCELSSYIRAKDAGISLMMVSSATSDNKFDVFQCGVDDYIVLSEDFRELLMRIRVLLKRSPRLLATENIIKVGDIVINLDSREVTRQDRAIFLTEREFRLLECLAHNKNKIVSKAEIAYSVWGGLCQGKNTRVAAFMNSLRGKIEDNCLQKCLYTVTGKGYLLEEKPR